MTAATSPRLRSISARHRLVDRVGGEQVPGGDGVALADAVAAVLGLVVHRRGPLELEERHVGRARERDALRGDAGGADDQLRTVRTPGTRRRSPRASASASRRAGARRAGSAPARPAGPRRGGRRRRAARRRRGSRGSRPARAASLPRAASRCSVPSCASRSARSVAAIFAFSSERSSGCSRSQAITSCSARRYSRSLSSATGTTTRRLAGSCGRTSAFGRRTKQRRRRCQCSRSSACMPRNSRAKRAPEPKSSSRPSTRSWRDQLLGVVEHRRAGQREPQPVGRNGLGEPPHRLGALGARVLEECDSSTTSARGRRRPSASRWAATSS